ncbi:MAG: hypothetical protein QXH91_05940 [Candidatus Bathyarchaeia archaeon]
MDRSLKYSIVAGTTSYLDTSLNFKIIGLSLTDRNLSFNIVPFYPRIGTIDLPNALTLTRTEKRLFVEKAIPGRSKAYRSDVGGLGKEYELEGLIHEPDPYQREIKKKQIADLADGTAKVFWEGMSSSVNVIISEVSFEKVADNPHAIRYRIRLHEQENI